MQPPPPVFVILEYLLGFLESSKARRPAQSFLKVPGKRTKTPTRLFCAAEGWKLPQTKECLERQGRQIGQVPAPTLRAGTNWDKALGSPVSPAKGPESSRASHTWGNRTWPDAFSQMTHPKKPGGQGFKRHYNALVNLKVKASVDLSISK